MNRMIFIASVASAISIGQLAKADGSTKRTPVETITAKSNFADPSWSCASPVVWLDIPSGLYYRKGEGGYGRTERGAYTCEQRAVEAGNRAN
ncbi:MAG TPA: hypothetical protein VGK84_10145 [Candidatus Tumulicola sp.]